MCHSVKNGQILYSMQIEPWVSFLLTAFLNIAVQKSYSLLKFGAQIILRYASKWSISPQNKFPQKSCQLQKWSTKLDLRFVKKLGVGNNFWHYFRSCQFLNTSTSYGILSCRYLIFDIFIDKAFSNILNFLFWVLRTPN